MQQVFIAEVFEDSDSSRLGVFSTAEKAGAWADSRPEHTGAVADKKANRRKGT